jgi:hypothetical protein
MPLVPLVGLDWLAVYLWAKWVKMTVSGAIGKPVGPLADFTHQLEHIYHLIGAYSMHTTHAQRNYEVGNPFTKFDVCDMPYYIKSSQLLRESHCVPRIRMDTVIWYPAPTDSGLDHQSSGQPGCIDVWAPSSWGVASQHPRVKIIR